MSLTFAAALASAGIDPPEALVIRHADVRKHENGTVDIHGGLRHPDALVFNMG